MDFEQKMQNIEEDYVPAWVHFHGGLIHVMQFWPIL
jgi:hypothetical protein